MVQLSQVFTRMAEKTIQEKNIGTFFEALSIKRLLLVFTTILIFTLFPAVTFAAYDLRAATAGITNIDDKELQIKGIENNANAVYKSAIDAGMSASEASTLQDTVLKAGEARLKNTSQYNDASYWDIVEETLGSTAATNERLAKLAEGEAAYKDSLSQIYSQIGNTTRADLESTSGQGYRQDATDSRNGKFENGEPIWCLRATSPFFSSTGCLAKISYLFLGVCSVVLWIAAITFNFVIDYSLNMAGFVQRIGIVQIGWETFRDFANLFFIFIILFIAINTILGNSSYGIKNLLGKVIIGAMLINFSLFFTNVIIDASNIFALQFYTKIIKDSGGSTTPDEASFVTYDGGISASVAKGLGLAEIWSLGRQTTNSTGDASASVIALNPGNLIVVGLMGGIFILITAVVFFAGAFMFLARTIVLIFLMILSPLAFVGGILPSTQQHAKKWWSKLFDAAIFAPVYMALLYLVLSMITRQNSDGGSFLDIFTGNAGKIDTLANFLILNSLMVGCLLVAKQMGAQGAGAALGAVDKIYGTAGSIVGYSTFGLAARAGRSVIGNGLAGAIQEGTKNSTSRTGLMLNRVGRSLANASFDARNIGDVGKKIGLGVDTTGGYKQRVEARNKVVEARANADFEALDAKGEGRRALINRLQSSSRKGTVKVGDELAKKNIDDETKKQREVLSEFKDKPEYQEFTRLVSKANSKDGLSPAEVKRVQELKTKLESMEIDRKDWDPTNGSWTERKGDKKAVSIGTISQHGIEVHFDNIKNLGDHAFAANTFTRTKKHTAEKKKPSNP